MTISEAKRMQKYLSDLATSYCGRKIEVKIFMDLKSLRRQSDENLIGCTNTNINEKSKKWYIQINGINEFLMDENGKTDPLYASGIFVHEALHQFYSMLSAEPEKTWMWITSGFFANIIEDMKIDASVKKIFSRSYAVLLHKTRNRDCNNSEENDSENVIEYSDDPESIFFQVREALSQLGIRRDISYSGIKLRKKTEEIIKKVFPIFIKGVRSKDIAERLDCSFRIVLAIYYEVYHKYKEEVKKCRSKQKTEC